MKYPTCHSNILSCNTYIRLLHQNQAQNEVLPLRILRLPHVLNWMYQGQSTLGERVQSFQREEIQVSGIVKL